MNRQKIEAAAGLLLQARRDSRLLAAMPPELAPAGSEEAYAIQHEVSRALGAIGGWKVGARGPDAEPSCAPLPASLMYRSPHSFAVPVSHKLGVEAEIALRLGRDLPPRTEPYRIEEMRAAVDLVLPAIEIVASRFANPGGENPLTTLADSLANHAFVYGEGIRDCTDLDFTRQPVKLAFGTTVAAEMIGGNPAGDIWRLLAWLANHVAANHGGLRAGQIVTTGSCTGLLFPQPGDMVSATFEGLGRAETSLA